MSENPFDRGLTLEEADALLRDWLSDNSMEGNELPLMIAEDWSSAAILIRYGYKMAIADARALKASPLSGLKETQ